MNRPKANLMNMTWILEPHIMPEVHSRLRASAETRGHALRTWRDDWVDRWPELEGPVVFHGSLGTAARVQAESPWTPGAFCNVDAFRCTTWYPAAGEWFLHREWRTLTVQELVDDPDAAFARLGSCTELFCRPDSPLKPFSGRVLQRDSVTLAALDHGFYFDDTSIEVILAPIRKVEQEWRYVVADGTVIAGSAYLADGRSASSDDPTGEPWQFASRVAQALPPPEEIYVLDVCAADGQLWLLELNPFSGADLYGCDTDAIVAAVSSLIGQV